MIIKKQKINFSILVALVLGLSTLTSLNKENLMVFAHDTYENIFRINPGFSSARNLVDRGGDSEFQSMLVKATNIIYSSNDIIKHTYTGKREELETISIQLKFKNHKKILEDRDKAIQRGFLDNPREVKGNILYKGDLYKAEIRLKGDLGDHWQSKHRMSLRVKLKGGRTIFGMNSFSIHKPRARQHPYDQAFQNLIVKSGGLATNFKFAEVKLNDENWGIMHVEEQLSKEYLEKMRRKESLIFRFSDDLRWKNYNKSTENKYTHYLLSDSSLFSSVYGSTKYFRNPHYRAIYTYILEERLNSNHVHLYNKTEHLKLFFMSLAWNNFHTLSDHNSKYYFNPYTLRLEPISSDQGILSSVNEKNFEILSDYNFPLNYKVIFDNLDPADDLVEIRDTSFKILENAELELNLFTKIFPLDAYKSAKKLNQNIDFLRNQDDFFRDKITISKFQTGSQRKIPTSHQAKDFLSHVHVRHYDNGDIKIFNLIPDDVKIVSLTIDRQPVNLTQKWVPSYMLKESIVLETNHQGIKDGKVEIVTAYQGQLRQHIAPPTLFSKKAFNPLLQNSNTNLHYIDEIDYGVFKIRKGSWKVSNPLFVKGKLIIEPGTNLDFSENAYLIVEGNIEVNGTGDEKVIFDSSAKKWRGIYVFSDTKKTSSINHMIVRNTVASEIGILKLTGGFTIYNSDLYISHLDIESTDAEDALNIVNSAINLNSLNISDAISDGLDCDFCSGTISNSTAAFISGDAFDFSGSEISIKGSLINNVKDKAFSIGENSSALITKSLIKDVGVGLAAKDSSSIYADEVTIENYTLHAAMSYQKKAIFNKNASVEINNSNIKGQNPFKRQLGSFMKVNGVEIDEEDIDVDRLYSDGIMKK